MDNVIAAIRKLRNDVKEMREKFKNEITKLREEVKALKQEMSQKEKQWGEERKMLKERILDIEESMEKKDREARKNNIVIKNVECKEQGLKQHLEQVLQSHIGVKPPVAFCTIVIVNLHSSFITPEESRKDEQSI
ncbi:hypothetical protein FQR65_LT07182 [Abscondita terminalis]|nr:hypothetical protein FQR65_LT07182 [Abscondita terminalis]